MRQVLIKEDKKMKKFKLMLLSSVLLAAPLMSCSTLSNINHRASENDLKVVRVELDQDYVKMEEGQMLQLTPTITYRDDVVVEVGKEWKSSNTKVATVDDKGVVTAIGGGTAIVVFMAGYESAHCTIEVPKQDSPITPTPTPTPVDPSIRLSDTEVNLGYNKTHQLSVVTELEGEVVWAVYSGSSVSVDSNGLVTSNSITGTSIVSASIGEAVAYCTFNVDDDSEQDFGKTVQYYFFLDYNCADEGDETGTRLLATFKWYPNRPVGESGLVPNDPANRSTSDPFADFRYFVGWSDHPIVDSKNDLIDVNTYTSGDTRTYQYIFGIWAEVTKEAFNK